MRCDVMSLTRALNRASSPTGHGTPPVSPGRPHTTTPTARLQHCCQPRPTSRQTPPLLHPYVRASSHMHACRHVAQRPRCRTSRRRRTCSKSDAVDLGCVKAQLVSQVPRNVNVDSPDKRLRGGHTDNSSLNTVAGAHKAAECKLVAVCVIISVGAHMQHHALRFHFSPAVVTRQGWPIGSSPQLGPSH